jgi:hypothetical protein
LRFDGELHGQVAKNFLAVAIDDETDGILSAKASLLAIEELVFTDA